MAYLTWKTGEANKTSASDTFEEENAGAGATPQQSMEFDATLLEDYTRAAEATEFPVEDGANVTDHLQPKQAVITLRVFVSDTPTQVPTTFADSTGSIRSTELDLPKYPPQTFSLPTSGRFYRNLSDQARVLIPNKGAKGPGASRANVLVFDGRLNRVVNIFEELNRHMTEKTPLSVILGASQVIGESNSVYTFDTMMITNINAPRTAADGSGMVFTLDLLQIKIVSRAFAFSNPNPEQNRGFGSLDKGRKNPPPLIDVEAMRNELREKLGVQQ